MRDMYQTFSNLFSFDLSDVTCCMSPHTFLSTRVSAWERRVTSVFCQKRENYYISGQLVDWTKKLCDYLQFLGDNDNCVNSNSWHTSRFPWNTNQTNYRVCNTFYNSWKFAQKSVRSAPHFSILRTYMYTVADRRENFDMLMSSRLQAYTWFVLTGWPWVPNILKVNNRCLSFDSEFVSTSYKAAV